MFEFVTEMSTWDQTFFYVAFGATLLLMGQLIMMFAGGDAGGDADMDGDGDFDDDGGAGSFTILTLKNIIGFLVGTGWGGLMLHLDMKYGKFASTIGAAVIGVGVMLLQSLAFWLMYKLHAPNKQTLSNAIGNIGEVYLGIPAGGSGKVTVTVNGTLSTLNATSKNNNAIKTNAMVEVVNVINDKLIVKEVSK